MGSEQFPLCAYEQHCLCGAGLAFDIHDFGLTSDSRAAGRFFDYDVIVRYQW